MDPSDSETFTSVLLVHNLHCPSCVTFAEEVLRPVSDVSHVTVSIVKHEIRFEHHRSETASAAVSELQRNAFEMQFVKILDSQGRTVTEYTVDGQRSKQPLYTWPLFLSKIQRKHVDNCNACRTKTASRPKRAKTWAAIRRRENSADVEKQGLQIPAPDAAASLTASCDQASDTDEKYQESAPQYVATLSIVGMTCVSCSNLITSELAGLDYVSHVNINLLTHSGTVVYTGAKENIYKVAETIDDLGYEAAVEEVKQALAGADDRSSPPKSTVWLSIPGMTSTSGVTTIVSSIRSLPFVHAIDIDLSESSGKVIFEGKENLDVILTKFGDLGYDTVVIDVKTQDIPKEWNDASSERVVTIAVEGMYCEHCPENIVTALHEQYGDSIVIDHAPTMQNPRIPIRYTPRSPNLNVRGLVRAVSNAHEAFSAQVWHPPTLEERSRAIQRQEQRLILFRLIFTFLVVIPVFLIGIVYMSLVSATDSVRIWFEEPVWAGNVSRTEWAMFIMTTPVMFFGADYFHIRAFKEIRALWRRSSKVPIARRLYRFGSMNMLISAGTGVAYISSVAVLIVDTQQSPTDAEGSQSSSYFDAVVFLSFFILIGKFLEAYSKSKTGDAVAMLSKLRPDEALLTESSSKASFEKEATEGQVLLHVPVDQLELDDQVRVLHGVSPPTDGTVLSTGTFLFDESSLTGESKPVEKVAGDEVFAGSVNVSQPVTISVTGIGGRSMLDKIVDAVREGQTKRAPAERIADAITGYFVPVITLLAIMTFVIWLSLGLSGALPERYLTNGRDSWAFWSLEFAIAVFVVACPCGLGLAAPTALFVGGGLAAKQGILVRGGGAAFEEASKLKVVVFDKTGTLTEGRMKVTGFEMLDGKQAKWNRSLALALSHAMELSSTHPIAAAIATYCVEQAEERIELAESDITELPGQGMRGRFSVRQDGEKLEFEAGLGNQRLLPSLHTEADGALPSSNVYLDQSLHNFQSHGQSTAVLYLRRHDPESKAPATCFEPVAVFGISDPIRESTPSVLSALRDKHNLEVHMCTGDNPTTALAIASQLNIPPANVRAGVNPVDKATYVNELRNAHGNSGAKSQKPNIVAFIGDGTNDTPALTAADVSIALSSGSDVAVSTASFILLNSDLHTVLHLFQLAKRVFARVKYNFFWAAVYNLVLVPIAAGVFFRLGDLDGQTGNGWRLGPVWASAAMALSSVSVVSSSLALRLPPVSAQGLSRWVAGRRG